MAVLLEVTGIMKLLNEGLAKLADEIFGSGDDYIGNCVYPPEDPYITYERASGKWSMEFNYGSPPKATLNLFQDGDVVYGTGVLILDPKTNLEVAAGGTVMGDKMNLDMISLGNVSLFRITMTVIENSASGTYTAYSPGAPPSSGPANAIRSPTRS
jgi:hypothetical protein